MKKITFIFSLFLLTVFFIGCKGKKGGGTAAPETLEGKLTRIAEFTLQIATVNGADQKTTFLVQKFTAVATDKKSVLTFYPSGTKDGNYKVNSETAFDLTYLDGSTTYTLSFTEVTLENDVLKGKLKIPTGAGGKTAEVIATVEYKK